MKPPPERSAARIVRIPSEASRGESAAIVLPGTRRPMLVSHFDSGEALGNKVFRKNGGKVVGPAGVVVPQRYAINHTRRVAGDPHLHA